MQRGREDINDLFDMGSPYSIFRGFGSRRSTIPSLFGGRDPFDDPFFSRPFGSLFESSMFDQSSSSRDITPTNNSKGIVIEELNSDHEGEKEDKGPEDQEMHSGSCKEPSVEHPDDDADDGKNEDVNYKTQHSKAKVQGTQPQARSFSFQTCKVTRGGVDGAYYTSSRTRRTGNDGVVLEESKEADRTTGQATHRISRGINDKGHSFTRKLNSDGKVDALQTLHNLNEDELTGFEEAWKGNANKHLPNWSDGFHMDRNAGPPGLFAPCAFKNTADEFSQWFQQLNHYSYSNEIASSSSHLAKVLSEMNKRECQLGVVGRFHPRSKPGTLE